MTYLELCQAVARESGTVSSLSAPSSVAGQSGRLQRVVLWTNEAHKTIQRRRKDWRWLRSEFSGETISGTRRYDASAMGIASRFSHWIFRDEGAAPTFSSYKTADGQDTEGWLTVAPWEDFRRKCLTGSAATDTGKPVYVAVDPAGDLSFHPIPDAAYTISGEYYRAPQDLSENDDIPEMPEQNHEAIVWQALIRLGTFDEAFGQIPVWEAMLEQHMDELRLTQTPRVRLGGPLA